MNTGYFTARNVAAATYANFRIPSWMEPFLAGDPRVLDIGCGFGQVLTALRDRGLTRLAGIDIEPEAVAHGRSLGHHVRQCSIADFLADPGGTWDVVVMSHVLEHLEKPAIIPTLARLRDILAPGGVLLLAVPNAQANTGAYWAYEDFTHTTLFTAGSVHYVGRMAGFASVEFLDADGTADSRGLKRLARKLLLRLYAANRRFWNRVTGSATHAGSPDIYSYDLKAALRG